VLKITDFGYVGSGQVADTAYADMRTVAVATSQDMSMPSGTYTFTVPVDLSGPNQLRLYGEGPDHTILTYTGAGAGILLGGSTTTRKSGVSGLYIRRGDGTLPATMVPGNYGISVPNAGAGTGVYVRDCAVVGFGDHAIRIAGPTGPSVVEDVEIYRCSGYGLSLANANGLAPQDVSIVRGSIQDMWGGIALGAGCTSTSAYDTDIELGANAKYPCLEIGVGGGHTFTNLSLSVGAPVWGNAVVYCEGFGNTFTGGLNFATGASETANFLFTGSNANRNTVTGGHYDNTTGGYFATVNGGVRNAFLNPDPTGNYAPGRWAVYDTSSPNNHSFVLGVPTAAGVEVVPANASAAQIAASLRALGLFT